MFSTYTHIKWTLYFNHFYPVYYCCIAVIHIQLYTYTCGNKINNNNERTHFFRKIYLSHFIRKGCERVVCERWVGDWTDCNILTPSSSDYSSTSFPFCWTAKPRVLRAQPSAGSWFSLPRTATRTSTAWRQLIQLSVAPGYIIVWRPPASCERCICTKFNPSTVEAISWYLRPDAPVSRLTAGRRSICYIIMTIKLLVS